MGGKAARTAVRATFESRAPGRRPSAAMLFTVTGITNKTLRGLMTGLLHRPYSMKPGQLRT